MVVFARATRSFKFFFLESCVCLLLLTTALILMTFCGKFKQKKRMAILAN